MRLVRLVGMFLIVAIVTLLTHLVLYTIPIFPTNDLTISYSRFVDNLLDKAYRLAWNWQLSSHNSWVPERVIVNKDYSNNQPIASLSLFGLIGGWSTEERVLSLGVGKDLGQTVKVRPRIIVDQEYNPNSLIFKVLVPPHMSKSGNSEWKHTTLNWKLLNDEQRVAELGWGCKDDLVRVSWKQDLSSVGGWIDWRGYLSQDINWIEAESIEIFQHNYSRCGNGIIEL